MRTTTALPARPRRGRRWHCWVAVAACAALSAGQTTSDSKPADPGVVTVESGPLVLRHVLSGRIGAERALDFATPDVGIYPLQIRWMAENGARVAPGDRIIEFDNSSLASRLEQLELQVDQETARLQTAISIALGKVGEAEFDLLQKQVALKRARISANVPEGLKSDLDYAKLQLEADKAALEEASAAERVEAARDEAQAEVDVARLALEKAEVALLGAQSKIERMVVTAPADGIVHVLQNWQQDRMFRAGDSTFPGMTIVRLPDPLTLLVEAELYDVDDGDVVEGLPASIVLDAYPSETLAGVVSAVDDVAQQRSRLSLRRVFDVRIRFTGELARASHPTGERPRSIAPGMSARVVVERRIGCGADGSQPCVLVDRSALDLRTPTRPIAVLVSGEERQLALGHCGHRACVVEGGLAAGDRLKIRNGAASR